jgi:NADH dehydrogenase [ubiquinone] 1 alpha subcomplex assembly factor 7
MTTQLRLENEIRRLIAASGPMPVARYMELCLTHPEAGYYVTRDPFGEGGDFTTAPEVSQIFGELIGLWALSVWRMLEQPAPVRLIELGPGRGTMMRDALRAAKVMPKFRAALSVHMVDVSPTLERAQRATLSEIDIPVTWHRDLIDVPEDGAAIILANEYLDAIPVHQMVKQASGWHERVIGLDANGNFKLGVTPEPVPQFDRFLPSKIKAAAEGAVFEWRNDIQVLDISRRVRRGGAALIIDYGHLESDLGETLQSVNEHAFSDHLSAPGLADITAHVDFAMAAQAAESMGAAVQGPVTQAHFLKELGIDARAEALRRKATPEQAADITSAVSRLTESGRTGMGDMFKVMAICDPKLASLPGLQKS